MYKENTEQVKDLQQQNKSLLASCAMLLEDKIKLEKKIAELTRENALLRIDNQQLYINFEE